MVFPCIADADDKDKESDSEEIDETELDKQLGDLGEEECDKLDEQMWGSEDENEEDPETQVCPFVTRVSE